MWVVPNRLRGAVVLVAAATLVLAGCSSEDPAQARDTARSACDTEAPRLPAGFDVRAATADQLSELAASAATRKVLAEQAATDDDRWQVLADAATAISSFAGVLRDAGMTGRAVDDVVTPEMWDQYKYASDAFVLECRDALALDR
jgi:cell division septation protein DedD